MLVAALGTAINFATDLKTSWIAWTAVGVLVLAGVIVTVRISRLASERSAAGTAIDLGLADGTSSEAYGLVMRTTEFVGADGSTTKRVEYFSEEVAVRVFRENFGRSDE